MHLQLRLQPVVSYSFWQAVRISRTLMLPVYAPSIEPQATRMKGLSTLQMDYATQDQLLRLLCFRRPLRWNKMLIPWLIGRPADHPGNPASSVYCSDTICALGNH